MRIVHTFRYHNKEFKAGELLVSHYMMFLRDPGYTLELLLTQYNKQAPKLTPRQMTRFINIMFDRKVEVAEALTGKSAMSEKTQKKMKQWIDDMHIWVSLVAKHTNLPVLDLPLVMFRKILEDLQYIVGSKDYDPDRKDKGVDHEKLKQRKGVLTNGS